MAGSLGGGVTQFPERVSNIIYKEVRGFASSLWRRQAEEFAANGRSFVVQPFSKELHWEFLQDLSERFQLTARFVALEKAAYFDPTPPG